MSTSAGARRGASASASASDGNAESTVLEEVNDPNYEPDQDEIEEYAEWLGMDLHHDKSLFWIAREGIKAQLPPSWKPCKAPNGDVYYFNFESGESIWDHPCDVQFREIFKAAKKSKELDQLSAPPRSALPPLSSRSIDCEPEEEAQLHIDDIAFSDDPVKVQEVEQMEAAAFAAIPSFISKLDFNRLVQAAQKVAETTLALAESSRLALEGEGSVGELRLLDDISSKLGLPRPSQVPAIDLRVLWGELAPVLESAASQSDLQSEEYSMLSTLRDAAQLASGVAASDEAINNSYDDSSFVFPSLEATGEGSFSSHSSQLQQSHSTAIGLDIARIESARRKGTMSRAGMLDSPQSGLTAEDSECGTAIKSEPTQQEPDAFVDKPAAEEVSKLSVSSAKDTHSAAGNSGARSPNPVASREGLSVVTSPVTSPQVEKRAAIAAEPYTAVAASASVPHNVELGKSSPGVQGNSAIHIPVHVDQTVGAAAGVKQSRAHKGSSNANKGRKNNGAANERDAGSVRGTATQGQDAHSVEAAHCVLGLLGSQGLLSARGKAEAAQDGIGDVVRHLASHSATSEVAKLKAEIAILRKAMNQNNPSAHTVMTSSVTAAGSSNKAQSSSKSSEKQRSRQQSSLMESRGRVRPRSAGTGSLTLHKQSNPAKQSNGPKSGLCRTAHGEMSGLLGQLQQWSTKEIGKERAVRNAGPRQSNERQSSSKNSKRGSRPGSAMDSHRAATVAASFSTFGGPKVKHRHTNATGVQQRSAVGGRRSASVNTTHKQSKSRQSKLSTLERNHTRSHAKPAPSSRSTVFIGAALNNTHATTQSRSQRKVRVT